MLPLKSPNLKSSPKLSVLLPSYNYRDGLLRILGRFEPFIGGDIEIIIGDNSTNDLIKKTVEPWVKKFPNRIKYFWNNPTKTPIQNWNFLIDEAIGEYVWIIHHDEFPETSQTIGDVLKRLSNSLLVDVFLLNCLLTFSGGRFIRPHFNIALRDWLIRLNPVYLLRRNVIGPTGILIIRRVLYPRFDLRLHWLVDVDVYVSLFLKNINWVSCPGVMIHSEQGRANSLTKGLGKSIQSIRKSELKYLQNRMHSRDIWLGSYPGEPIERKLLRFFEATIWMAYRVVTKSLAYIFFTPASLEMP